MLTVSELNAATSVVSGERLPRWLRLGWLWRGGYRGELLVLCLVALGVASALLRRPQASPKRPEAARV